MAAAIGLALGASGAAIAQEGPGRHITVIGMGEVAVVPDMAQVEIGVTEEAVDAAAAIDAMSAATERVLARLREAGIAERDIQTGSLRLDPRYTDPREPGQTPEINGFVASNMLSVRVRDLAALGGLLDVVVESGANRLSGIRFDLAEREPLKKEARRAAVADALEKAALYAEAAGLALGDVQIISETGNGGGPQPFMDSVAQFARSVPIAPGETTVTAQVQVVIGLRSEASAGE